ncbi:MAG: hypothetical protein ABSD67_03070 [Terracidiphilus sp.]|jgi:hypothetical protein
MEGGASLTNVRNAKQITFLIGATVMSLTMFIFGAGLWTFSGSQTQSLSSKLIWRAPMLGLPTFALAFVSRKVLAWAMWVVVIANYCGEYVLIWDECSRVICTTKNTLVIALGAFLGPAVILSIFAAALVQYAYRLERREALEID